jgi:DNA-binding CsgD family transcriptional regulator
METEELAGVEPLPVRAGRLLDELAHGRSGLVAVESGPGGGKTTLLHQVVRAGAGHPELTVLRARCSPDEHDFEFGVVRQLLEASIGRTELDPLEERHPDFWEATSHECLRRLYRLLADFVAHRPTLIAIDDIQWADRPSLRFLSHLSRRLDQLPVLLLLAWDPQEPCASGSLITEVTRDPAALIWRLPPLGAGEVAALCRQAMGTDADDVVAACLRLTQGVPFLVTELLAQAGRLRARSGESVRETLLRCAPVSVATVTLARVRRHGRHLVTALRALSVLRVPVSLTQAAQITGLRLAQVEDAVAALRRLSVAAPGAGVLVAPELVRHAVRQALHPSERQAAHVRAAAALAEADATREAAARHLVETHPTGRSAHVDLLRQVAAQVSARGAVELAAALLRRALREPPPPEHLSSVRAELGAVELCYDGPSAVLDLTAARNGQPPGEARADCTLKLAYGLVMTGSSAEATAILEEELATCGLPADHHLARRMRSELLFASFGDDRVHRAVVQRYGRPDVGGAGTAAPDRAGRVALAAAALLDAFDCRPASSVIGAAHAALTGDLAPGEGGAIALLAAGAVVMWSDDLVAAERFFEQFAVESQRHRAPLVESIATSMRALVAVRRGDLAGAAAHTETATRLVSDRRWDHWRLAPLLPVMELALEHGTAVDVLARFVDEDLGGDLPRLWLGSLVLAGRGRLRVVTGDVRRGLADLEEAGRRLVEIGCRNPAIVPWRSAAAEAHHLLGAPDQALALADDEVTLARAWGAPRALAVALRQRGLLRSGREGLADLDEALSIVDREAIPLDRARLLLAKGRLHRTQRQAQLSRTALTEAYELAETRASADLVGRVRDELLASGGRPRVRNPGQRSVLTGSEARVARMVVSGLTNDEVARQLYLARRTVEAHLTSVYRKLGIRGRSQLAAALPVAPD